MDGFGIFFLVGKSTWNVKSLLSTTNEMSICCCHFLILDLILDDSSGKKSRLCLSKREKDTELLPVFKEVGDEAVRT